jgi:hypothetical protein
VRPYCCHPLSDRRRGFRKNSTRADLPRPLVVSPQSVRERLRMQLERDAERQRQLRWCFHELRVRRGRAVQLIKLVPLHGRSASNAGAARSVNERVMRCSSV